MIIVPAFDITSFRHLDNGNIHTNLTKDYIESLSKEQLLELKVLLDKIIIGGEYDKKKKHI